MKKPATLRSLSLLVCGCIAAVVSQLDSFESHVKDTLIAGAGLCEEPVVRLTVTEAPERVAELRDLGVRFTERQSIVDLGLEAGHSHRRILHAVTWPGWGQAMPVDDRRLGRTIE